MQQDSTPKKQKAGLGAVRPDDWITKTFKELAANKDLSQTELFERIFLAYIHDEREKSKNDAIDFTGEINLIANNISQVLTHFKTIASKSQNTILALNSNISQTEETYNLQVDTLNKKLEELLLRNSELEQSNTNFTELKNELLSTIKEQCESITTLKAIEKEYLKQLSDYEKLKKYNDQLEKSLARANEDLELKHTQIQNLQTTNSSLNDTLKQLQDLKQSEITAIESNKNLLIKSLEQKLIALQDINTVEKESLISSHTIEVSELQSKLTILQEQRDTEIKTIEDRVTKELSSKHQLDIANLKLELADSKTKYMELLSTTSNPTAPAKTKTKAASK